jgi:hypothetical protein
VYSVFYNYLNEVKTLLDFLLDDACHKPDDTDFGKPLENTDGLLNPVRHTFGAAKKSKNKLPFWATVFIIIGITLVIVTIVIIICCVLNKRKKCTCATEVQETVPIKETYLNTYYRKVPNGIGGYTVQTINKPNMFAGYGI